MKKVLMVIFLGFGATVFAQESTEKQSEASFQSTAQKPAKPSASAEKKAVKIDKAKLQQMKTQSKPKAAASGTATPATKEENN